MSKKPSLFGKSKGKSDIVVCNEFAVMFYNGLKSKRLIAQHAKVNLVIWSKVFDRLQKQVGVVRLSAATRWYVKNVDNPKVVTVSSAKGFYNSFYIIEEAMRRAEPIKVSDECKELLKEVQKLSWNPIVRPCLPQAVQVSMDNYSEAHRLFSKYFEVVHSSLKEEKGRKLQLNWILYNTLNHLRHKYMTFPEDFLRAWFEEASRMTSTWKVFYDGVADRHITFTVNHSQFRNAVCATCYEYDFDDGYDTATTVLQHMGTDPA